MVAWLSRSVLDARLVPRETIFLGFFSYRPEEQFFSASLISSSFFLYSFFLKSRRFCRASRFVFWFKLCLRAFPSLLRFSFFTIQHGGIYLYNLLIRKPLKGVRGQRRQSRWRILQTRFPSSLPSPSSLPPLPRHRRRARLLFFRIKTTFR